MFLVSRRYSSVDLLIIVGQPARGGASLAQLKAAVQALAQCHDDA